MQRRKLARNGLQREEVPTESKKTKTKDNATPKKDQEQQDAGEDDGLQAHLEQLLEEMDEEDVPAQPARRVRLKRSDAAFFPTPDAKANPETPVSESKADKKQAKKEARKAEKKARKELARAKRAEEKATHEAEKETGEEEKETGEEPMPKECAKPKSKKSSPKKGPRAEKESEEIPPGKKKVKENEPPQEREWSQDRQPDTLDGSWYPSCNMNLNTCLLPLPKHIIVLVSKQIPFLMCESIKNTNARRQNRMSNLLLTPKPTLINLRSCASLELGQAALRSTKDLEPHTFYTLARNPNPNSASRRTPTSSTRCPPSARPHLRSWNRSSDVRTIAWSEPFIKHRLNLFCRPATMILWVLQVWILGMQDHC